MKKSLFLALFFMIGNSDAVTKLIIHNQQEGAFKELYVFVDNHYTSTIDPQSEEIIAVNENNVITLSPSETAIPLVKLQIFSKNGMPPEHVNSFKASALSVENNAGVGQDAEGNKTITIKYPGLIAYISEE